jgi:DNA mismatch repair ATPase MutL
VFHRINNGGSDTRNKIGLKNIHDKYNDNNFSHGYRGQALVSILEQCNLEIISRVKENQIANSKKFIDGVESISQCARAIGTTIKILDNLIIGTAN